MGGAGEAFTGDALAERLAARGAELGALVSAEPTAALRRQAEAALVAAVVERDVPLAALAVQGPVSLTALHAARDRLLEEVGAQAEALRRRAADASDLDPADEWGAFTAALDGYSRAARLGGPTTRALAFQSVFAPMTDWAARLYNRRGERMIANAVFRWLLGEAYANEAAGAAELALKNLRVGYR